VIVGEHIGCSQRLLHDVAAEVVGQQPRCRRARSRLGRHAAAAAAAVDWQTGASGRIAAVPRNVEALRTLGGAQFHRIPALQQPQTSVKTFAAKRRLCLAKMLSGDLTAGDAASAEWQLAGNSI